MKYNIVINQLALSKTKLDLIDAAILDYLYVYCNSLNKQIETNRLRDNTGVWTWVNYEQLLDDMPLLSKILSRKTSLVSRFNKLEKEGFIKTKLGQFSRKYIQLTERVDSMFIKMNVKGSNVHVDEPSVQRSPTCTDYTTKLVTSIESNNTTIPSEFSKENALIRESKDLATKKGKQSIQIQISSLIHYFRGEVKSAWGVDPAINSAPVRILLSRLLKKYSTDELKRLIDYYLSSDKIKKHSFNLTVALSTDTINKWLLEEEATA